jgi:hypothetical protein
MESISKRTERQAEQKRCSHDWIGAGWGRLTCTICGKRSTMKRVDAAIKAAAVAKAIRISRSMD